MPELIVNPPLHVNVSPVVVLFKVSVFVVTLHNPVLVQVAPPFDKVTIWADAPAKVKAPGQVNVLAVKVVAAVILIVGNVPVTVDKSVTVPPLTDNVPDVEVIALVRLALLVRVSVCVPKASVPVYPVSSRTAAAAALVIVIFPEDEFKVAVSPATGVPKAAAHVPWSAITEVQTFADQLPPEVQAYQVVA